MKKIKGLLLTLFLATVLTACGGNKENAPSGAQAVTPSAATQSPASDEAKAVPEKPAKDRAGNEIKVPETVNTIVSLAPATTQVLCDLGLASSLVAVDTNSPQYVQGLKEGIVQFDMMQPDLEQIVVLKPDLVLASTMSNQGGDDIFKAIRDAGICVALIPTSDTIEDVKKDVQFIADCVGKNGEGETLVQGMEKDINTVAELAKAVTDKKAVLFEISPAPYLYSFGTGVYLNEMLELIGAENVLSDQKGWISVTEESAVAANPDVILTSDNFSGGDPVKEIEGRKGWKNVNAVKNGEVYYINNAASSLPNHHITEALKEMAKAIYPDIYGDLK